VLKPNYIEYRLGSQSAYVRTDKLSEIRRIDVIVFDCDGVLIDISESYPRAVAKTTRVLVEAFTGATLPESLFDGALNSAYKQRGGFNNDWTLAYALVMRILAESHDAESINRLALESLRCPDIHGRYKFIQENRVDARIDSAGLHGKLMDFSMVLDETGVESVDAKLLPELESVKRALSHPGGVGESMVSTMFEEFFLGAKLFQETFQIPATFNESPVGYVENEKVVIADKALDWLAALIGGPRFGIASGSLADTARHVLGGTLSRFNPAAQVWHDDVAAAERETGGSLHKPSPYPLLRASEPYRPYNRVLYVGDTMADKLMTENAGEGFLFAGVFGCVAAKEETRSALLEAGSAMVLASVNQLPTLLRLLK
jgi:phosphoglycolate phosphatase-like HAD superfamily hydrolase